MKNGSDIHKIIEIFLKSSRICNANDRFLLKNMERALNKRKWIYFESETVYNRLNVRGRIDAIFKCGSSYILVDWKVTKRNIRIQQVNETFDAFYGNYEALHVLQMNLYNFIYNQQNAEMYIGNIVGNKIKMIKCQKLSRIFIERIICNYNRMRS